MKRGRGGHTYQGPSIEDPMEGGREGGREGGFAHIRVHLFRILWRKGRFTHIRVHLLRIL